MTHNDSNLLFRSGLCSVCNVPTDFLQPDDEGQWLCPAHLTRKDQTMAKAFPNTVDQSNEFQVEAFEWTSKRALWDILINNTPGDDNDERHANLVKLLVDEGVAFSKKLKEHFGVVKAEPEPIEAESLERIGVTLRDSVRHVGA